MVEAPGVAGTGAGPDNGQAGAFRRAWVGGKANHNAFPTLYSERGGERGEGESAF